MAETDDTSDVGGIESEAVIDSFTATDDYGNEVEVSYEMRGVTSGYSYIDPYDVSYGGVPVSYPHINRWWITAYFPNPPTNYPMPNLGNALMRDEHHRIETVEARDNLNGQHIELGAPKPSSDDLNNSVDISWALSVVHPVAGLAGELLKGNLSSYSGSVEQSALDYIDWDIDYGISGTGLPTSQEDSTGVRADIEYRDDEMPSTFENKVTSSIGLLYYGEDGYIYGSSPEVTYNPAFQAERQL